jgi:hypothetical protein
VPRFSSGEATAAASRHAPATPSNIGVGRWSALAQAIAMPGSRCAAGRLSDGARERRIFDAMCREAAASRERPGASRSKSASFWGVWTSTTRPSR